MIQVMLNAQKIVLRLPQEDLIDHENKKKRKDVELFSCLYEKYII